MSLDKPTLEELSTDLMIMWTNLHQQAKAIRVDLELQEIEARKLENMISNEFERLTNIISKNLDQQELPWG